MEESSGIRGLTKDDSVVLRVEVGSVGGRGSSSGSAMEEDNRLMRSKKSKQGQTD
jgi:hypothetical protein